MTGPAATARYVAIITDGNGRWAESQGLPTLEGHRAGADNVKARLRDAVDLGIKELTVYSFSTENWSRPAAEVAGLMEMFAERITTETPELRQEGVRMRFIGRRDRIGATLLERIEWAEAETAENELLTLFIAFDYGSRAEIVDAAARYQGGGEDAFAELLYAPEMNDPDLLIRTGETSVFRTTCSGNAPTPSSYFATRCGPTSVATRWSTRCNSSPRANDVSVAANEPRVLND